MSKRNAIIDGRFAANARNGLVYTEVLGWIDLGHARGDDIRTLMRKFKPPFLTRIVNQAMLLLRQ